MDTGLGSHRALELRGQALRDADAVRLRLLDANRTVAVAESLTGGLISAFLTTAPGTSAIFRGGLVVYATELKHVLAGVESDLLDRQGPVDATVAEQLASGTRRRLESDYAVSATGVAGPTEQGGHPRGRGVHRTGHAGRGDRHQAPVLR